MANITATSAAAAIPEFWLQEAIGYLRANLVMARLVRRDGSAAIAQMGDTVNVTKRGSVTAKDKAANTAIVTDAPSDTKVAVTLNKHKYVAWALEDTAGAEALKSALDYLSDGMAHLAEAVETDLLALYPDIANSVGTAGKDLNELTILQARKQMNDQKAPVNNRNLIVSTKDDIALLGLEKFSTVDDRGQAGAEALTEAKLGRIHGFNCYMSQLIATTGTSPVNTHNIAFHPNAFMLVSRALPRPDNASGAVSVTMTDPVTGITMRYTKQYNIANLATTHVIDVLYGVQSVDEDRLAVEVTT